MQNNRKAYLFTALAILFWATAASAFKIALAQVSPFVLLFYSAFFSLLILGGVLVAQKKLRLLKAGPSFWIHSALAGFLNPFLYYFILFQAYDRLPGQVAMALNYLWPIVLMLLAIPLLRQSVSSRQVLAILISFGGSLIIATKGQITVFSGLDGPGVALALGSTVIWALFWLINTRDKHDPVLKLFGGFVFGAFYSLLPMLITEGFVVPQFMATAALLYIGAFEMGFTFVLWLSALKYAERAAQVGQLIYITPFLSLLFLWLIIDEAIYLSTVAGLVLIVGGIMLNQKKKKPARQA